MIAVTHGLGGKAQCRRNIAAVAQTQIAEPQALVIGVVAQFSKPATQTRGARISADRAYLQAQIEFTATAYLGRCQQQPQAQGQCAGHGVQ